MDAILVQLQTILADSRPHIDTTMTALASGAVKTDAFMTQSRATMEQMQDTIRNLEERLAVTAENLLSWAEDNELGLALLRRDA